jgi:hypothetical protein
MSSPFELQAIIEFSGFTTKSAFPWEVAEIEKFSLIRLSAETTYPEIGLVFAEIAWYNQIDFSGNSEAILNRILAAKSLALAGGLQVVVEGEEKIWPSCCCGLEGWGEWQDFLKTGQTSWLGHDPSPWLEQVDGLIRIWSDGGLDGSVSGAFKIEVERSVFEQALQSVERDLLGFRYCIESWCGEVGFGRSSELAQKIERCFQIGMRHL